MRLTKILALAGAALLVTSCGADDSTAGTGVTEVEFFQFKTEAVETFDRLIENFEAEHPDIDVVQNNVPAADTALRTRLVKNDIPDVMTLNGNGATYGDLASSGIFRDFTGDEALDRTSQASQDILNALGRTEEETNGVPFANNADGVLYNTDIFDELGLQVPTTWDEFISAAQTAQDAGLVPFFHTWQEAWTTLPPFNVLAQVIPEEDFWEQRLAGETSFSEAWPPWCRRSSSSRSSARPTRSATTTTPATEPWPTASRRCTCRASGRSRPSGRSTPTSPSAPSCFRPATTRSATGWCQEWTWCSPCPSKRPTEPRQR
jgi:raffinose/stachyose/melibiose transport system substrate-binding protein